LRFINLPLTYLDTQFTYSPGTHTGQNIYKFNYLCYINANNYFNFYTYYTIVILQTIIITQMMFIEGVGD